MKQQITIRADASSTIGSGHVMRCLTMADALRQNGAGALFVCRTHPGNLCALIEARGHAVVRLPVHSESSEAEDPDGDWLGAPRQTDAKETGDAIAAHWREPADWLIIDHYAIDSKWESALRPYAHRVMAIDDLANRRHDCDILLDQNLVEGFEDRYDGLVPGACVRLLGPDYALLGPEYAELHTKLRRRDGPVRTILVSFGGADPFGLTEKALRAFVSLERPDIRLDVVIGRMAPSLPAIRTLAQEHGNITIHSGLPSLAPLMAKADLAIGAAGTTSWERCCLGLPSIVAAVAANQREVAGKLEMAGVVWLINEDDMFGAHLQNIVCSLASDPTQLSLASERAARIVDGLGCERVLSSILADG